MNELIVRSFCNYIAKLVAVAFALGVAVTVLFSCTLSMIMTDTHGTATDVVDENQAASPDIKADISVPVSALPSIVGK